MKNALLPKLRLARPDGLPRNVTRAAAAVLATLVSSTALAVDVESAAYDVDDNRLVLAGVDLRDVDDVTVANVNGKETSIAFRLTRERNPRIVAQLTDDTPGTYRLRVYSNTVLQDEMDVSVPSRAGSVSREATTQRTNSTTCLVSKCTVYARCPNGYRAIGGGFRKLTFNAALIDVDASYAADATRWRVDFRKSNPNTYSISLEAQAICLKQN